MVKVSRGLVRVIGCLAPFLIVVAAYAAPRVVVPQSTIDLGVMRAGNDADVEFVIENRGDRPLRIESVDPGCSCTATEFDDVIPAGGSGKIRARLMTADLGGPVTKGIVVTTDDPTSPELMLTLKAVVLTNFELLPQAVVFMRAQDDGEVVGRMLVRKQNDVEGAVRISNIDASRDIFEARAVEVTEVRPRGGGLPAAQPGDWLVEVRFRSGVTRFGRIRERLRFDTGLELQPSIEVPIESTLDVPVVFSARTLELNRSADGKWRGSCFASVQKGIDAKGLRVESKPDALQVTTTVVGERLVRLDLEAASEFGDSVVEFRVGKFRVSLPVQSAP